MPEATDVELRAMRRAIALSALGVGSTSPNPPVGCVILDSAGRIVGEGFHRRKGEPHAEALAIAAAGTRAAGGLAMVTLEPCNHHGRTPPCHQALIDAGVARVLIAALDPTSRGEGGAARLRDAGLGVDVGILEEEALTVLGPWLRALRLRRPIVTWAYQLDSHGISALPDDGLDDVRNRFDTVLFEDGSLEEGMSGAHGSDAFVLKATDVATPLDVKLSAVYDGGTRTLLLHGGHKLADPFHKVGVLDEVILHIPSPSSSRLADDPPLLPTSFAISTVRKLVDGVVIEATAVAASGAPGQR